MLERLVENCTGVVVYEDDSEAFQGTGSVIEEMSGCFSCGCSRMKGGRDLGGMVTDM